MSPTLMFNHLKVGFQRPDDVIDWRRGFRSRWSDNRKKATATTPRMTTPEIRELVTGFIGWELAGEAGKCSVESSRFMPASYYMTLRPSFFICCFFFLLTYLVILSIIINLWSDNSYAHLPSWELLMGFSSEKWFHRGLLACLWLRSCIKCNYLASSVYL